MVVLLTILLLALICKNSLQSCSSTVGITTCTWDTLRSNIPLHLDDYKPYLSFTKGTLDHISNGAFKLFPQVTVLQLSRNKIKELEEQSFEGLLNLKELKLYDNKLTAVNQNIFKHCRNLEKLDLGMNEISFIHEKAFEHLELLEELNLAFNSLKSVPGAVNFLPHLRILKLSNNAIDNLKSNAFSKLSKLEELSLNDNRLIKIETDAFKGLSKLKTLDLRSNFLTDINVADLIDDARNLNSISLSLNEYKCDSLRKILESFKRNYVEVSRGFSKSPNSINGISCKSS